MPQSHPTDPLPVVAVRVFVQDAASRILLLQRGQRTYAAGCWSLPGGKVKYMESPEAAAVREVAEETGLVIDDVRFLFHQSSLPDSAGQMHCINLYFDAVAQGEVTLNDESQSSVWVSLDEALMRQPVFGAREAIERVRSMGLA